jgi:sporulation protein YtfJ
MEIVANLAKTTLEELEKVLTARTVVGEPITIEGSTLIPLISVGFGFGAGGGSGKGESKQKGEGEGGGTGGGAWVKPIAVVIIDKDGVRVEPIRRGLSTMMEKIGDTVPKVVDKIMEKKEERKKEG